LTPPSLSSLHLGTLNTAEAQVLRSLRDDVCQWEQNALDAANRGDYDSAHQYKQWAVAADLAHSKALVAFSALVLEALGQPVQELRSVQLPNLKRSAKDLALDVLAVEVASHQPEPEPA